VPCSRSSRRAAVRAASSAVDWGVIAPFDSTIVPPGTEPLGLPIALTRAQAIVYGQEIQKVRAALKRVQAALPKEDEYPQGQLNVSEYDRRVTSHIQKEMAVWDKLEADMGSLLREMDRRY
jgi:hypothetical protein